MLNHLKAKIKSLTELLHGIPHGCEKCNKGYMVKQFDILKSKMSFNIVCDCQSINGITKHELLENINDYELMLIRIKKEIPKDFWYNVYFNNQDEKLKNFYNNDNIFLWIHSRTNGNGKTSAMYSFIMKQIEDCKIYTNRIINECNFNYQVDIKDIFVDDVFKVKIPDRLKNLIPLYYNLINYKRENREKIIFTSNYSLSEFLKEISVYDKDIASAIHDRMFNITDSIEMTGESYRKKGECHER